MGGVRKLLALVPVALVLLLPRPGAATTGGRPVALVTAETANEVLAVSLGKYGGHIIRRAHLVDPLMIACVTLLAWHSLRPIKVFHGFVLPEVAEVAPNGQLAYVTDERTGDLTVIDLHQRRIVGRVLRRAAGPPLRNQSRRQPDMGGPVEASNPRKPRVAGRIHPPHGAHDVGFTPNGKLAWVTSPTAAQVEVYSAAGKLLEGAKADRGPQHVAFSGSNALVSSGYGSSLESIVWRAPYHRLRTVTVPYGSFNLATYGGFVVTTSLFTGKVTELQVSGLHRVWTAKVAPAARYVAISVWPR